MCTCYLCVVLTLVYVLQGSSHSSGAGAGSSDPKNDPSPGTGSHRPGHLQQPETGEIHARAHTAVFLEMLGVFAV